MSYQALARQFRPQNFTELVGQEHVSQALINGLENDRIHHAFLFTGTRGVGKTTVARILAKALNCEKGVTGSPCGVCSACTQISEGRFVDLVEVDAASRTGVDDTRELLENVQYAPTSGRYKIYLIDEVHMFSKSSFNALLKTLEEPPPHVKFLLATTEPKKLPVTVLSRCLQFNLKRLSLMQINNHLIKLLELQNIAYDASAIELIARAAEGSMRDGLSLLDQSIAFGAGNVKEEGVKLMLGTIDKNSVVDLLIYIAAKDAENLSSQLQQIFEMSPDYALFLNDMALLLHEISLLQILNKYVESSRFDKQTLVKFAQGISHEQVQLYYQIVIKGQEEINLAPDSKTGFEMTILRLFAFKIGQFPTAEKKTPESTPGQLNQQQNTTQSTINQPNQNNSAQNPKVEPIYPEQTLTVQETPPVQQQFNLNEITQTNWASIFNALPIRGTARELARNSLVVSNDKGKLVLSVDKQTHAFMTDRACKNLKKALLDCVRETIAVEICEGGDHTQTIARTEQLIQDTNVQETKQKVSQNPFVLNMQENFDAQVIQIKDGQNFLEV